MSLNVAAASRGVLVAALLFVTPVGCAHQHAATTAASNVVPVVFSNESTDQAEVWVVAPNVNTRRLGAVLAGETTTLRVPGEFFSNSTISFYTKMRGSSGGPGLYDLPIREGEPLRIRLPKGRTRLEVVR